jgi:hypothetical protein
MGRRLVLRYQTQYAFKSVKPCRFVKSSERLLVDLSQVDGLDSMAHALSVTLWARGRVPQIARTRRTERDGLCESAAFAARLVGFVQARRTAADAHVSVDDAKVLHVDLRRAFGGRF